MSLTPKILSFAVMMALAGAASAANTNSPAVGRALGLIQIHASQARATANDKFVATDVMVDSDGTEHVRFDRTFKGLPVIGGDLVVESRGGQLKATWLTLGSPINLSTRARLGSADATVAAGAEFGSRFEGSPSSSLVVYARDKGAAKLAYQVQLQNEAADMTYIVDANSGKLLDRWSNRQTNAATGTGQTYYSGNVPIGVDSTSTGFQLKDIGRGGTQTNDFNNGSTSKPGPGTIFTSSTSTFGNGSLANRATAGADAHFGVALTWDYFQTLGRNGIANNGVGSYSRVHVGRNYVNAFWSDSCFCMSYGDGDGVTYSPLVDIDVAGHEMSHGVTSRSAKLTYSGESGGLNEATSDIFGSMVEFYANNGIDTPDYMIGEEIYIANVAGSANQKALRYMFNPIKDTRSPNCYVSTLGSLDVHYSSGVANHFFYLLAEGSGAHTYSGVDHASPTCNGSSLAGIGRDAAAKIWYRALTTKMVSNTNYAGARTATIAAANELVTLGTITSAQASAVAATWSAVSVN